MRELHMNSMPPGEAVQPGTPGAPVIGKSVAPCARVLSTQFSAKSGAQLFDGVFLGRELGAGVQAKVFELVRADGSSVNKVLKVGHSDLGHTLFLNAMASSMMDLQREWELGMRLKAALEEPDGSLPGFTRTCDCTVIVRDTYRNKATFQGMIMEKINGWPVSKRISDPAFHNIHYVREMLFQVFSALDRAQRALGFNHSDLGLNNVMEHYPQLLPEVARGEQEANAAALVRGSACLPCAKGAVLEPGHGSPWQRSQSGLGCSVPPPVEGFSVDSSGELSPLGPHIEFKIIDYGVGEFNEVLAQAAGGHEPLVTMQRIQEAFAARGIPIGGDSKRIDLEVDAGGELSLDGKDLALHALGANSRFLVVDATASEQGGAKEQLPSPPSSLGGASSSLARGRQSPVERMFRSFWSRKGDVFHLLLALGVALDDVVWPKRDERDVQLFISLVHHVTGIKMRAHFASVEDRKHVQTVMGKRRKRHAPSEEETLYGARVRCFAALRRTRLMLKAHLKPFNSGLLAGEALVAPFFGLKGAPHAQLPVCVEAAFPFRVVPLSPYRG